MGPSHCMKRCKPPKSRMSSSPGRRWRWYALLRIICAPIACRSSGSSDLTVASVPTAMNAGVSTTPCGVVNRPARAAPCCASSENANSDTWLQNAIAVNGGGIRSDDGHRVAVRIKAIPVRNGFAIRAHRQLVPRERGDEHDQRRTWQMQVGDDAVDRPKPIWRPNEDARLTLSRANDAVFVRRAFQRAHARRPHGPHVSPG